MKEHDEVEDTPTKILKLLKDVAESETINTDVKGCDFPAAASWLARKLVPIVPTLEAFRISVEDGMRGSGKSKERYIRFSRDLGVGQQPPDWDSKEEMLYPTFADTYAVGTARDSRTAYLPENSKDTEERIDGGVVEDSVLFSGKNAVPAVPAVPEAYLSQKVGNSISDDAVPADGDAVPRVSPGGKYDEFSPAVQAYYWQQREYGRSHATALWLANAYEPEGS
jgi:hypothetical protein